MNPQSPSQPNWPLLAVWRFALAAIVFCTHLDMVYGAGGNPLSFVEKFGPFAAVLMFFRLSGFSIRHAVGKHPARVFYVRRARRILPALFGAQIVAAIALAIGGGFIGWPGGGKAELPGTDAASGLLLFFVHALPVQSVILAPPEWNMPAWSLGIEAFYYLLAPGLLFLPRRSLWALVALSVVLFFYFDVRETFSLGAGPHIALALAWSWILGWIEPDANDTERQIIALLPLVVIGACHQHRGPYDTLTVAATSLLMANAHRITVPKKAVRAANWLGDISYTLYIVHWPALLLLAGVLKITTPLALVMSAVVLIVAVHVVLAWITKARISASSIGSQRSGSAA